MGFPSAMDGDEQFPQGEYELICYHCGYPNPNFQITSPNNRPRVVCINCGKEIDIEKAYREGYIRKVS